MGTSTGSLWMRLRFSMCFRGGVSVYVTGHTGPSMEALSTDTSNS